MLSQSFSAALSAPARHLSLTGEIELLTGTCLSFDGTQVLSFSMHTGAGDGLLLGGVFSSACTLVLRDENGCFTQGYSFRGALVRIFLQAGEERAPLAHFYVDALSHQPAENRLTLSGSDALSSALDGLFEDPFSYPITLQAMAAAIAAQAGLALSGSFPNQHQPIASPPFWGEISLRQALGYVAGAAGCFAMLDGAGSLVVCPVWPSAPALTLPASQVLSREEGERVLGPLTALQIFLSGAERNAPPLLLQSGDNPPSSANCLQISGNPLFFDGAAHLSSLSQGLLSCVAGLTLTPFRLTWRGDPSLMLGDRLRLSMPDGSTEEMLITRQSLSFHQGFTMQSDCTIRPRQDTAGRLFTPSGSLNAARLSGTLDGAMIRDGSIAAAAITAGSITSLQLSTASVSTEKLAAQAVTTNQLAADAVTADKLSANAVSARNLSADALKAIDAHIVSADIDWAKVESLQAAIADITSAEIQNVEIDFGRIKDLSADTAIITKGTAGELYISRLAVTETNMVSLTVGQLMVKGKDGAFYAVSVDEQGNVKAEKKLVENADIGNQTINAGEKLIEGSVTAATMNAREIFGDSALIRQLIATNLDVDTLFAREAMIAKLNALDITGNESIRIYVQKQDEMNAFLRVTEDGLEIGRVGDPAVFRADNRTLEVTNIKTERLGVTQRMSENEEWAVSAYDSGLSIKWIGGDV
ncbi:MAG: hypothetical protein E7324_04695 [Clostridiales bacterium]|nr:hypothetical protein [Clostridiales bacterium]